MPVENIPEETFKIRYFESTKQLVIEFQDSFTFDNWDYLTALTKPWIEKEIVNWDLDLRRLQLINSLGLGAIIGLNMVLNGRKGRLRLVVEKGSRIASLFYLSKIHRIVTILEAGKATAIQEIDKS